MSLRIPVVATGQSCPGAAPAANCVLAGDSAETQAWLSEAPGPQADRGLTSSQLIRFCRAVLLPEVETQPHAGQMSAWLPVSTLVIRREKSSPASVLSYVYFKSCIRCLLKLRMFVLEIKQTNPPSGTSNSRHKPFKNLPCAPAWALFSVPGPKVLGPDCYQIHLRDAWPLAQPEAEPLGMESVSVTSSPGESR